MLEHLDMEKTTNSHSEVDSEEDEEVSRILGKFMKKNSKKQKVGRKPQWTTILAKEVVDIILENDKFKEKSLLTNVKNSKNSQYYLQVIDELKDRCKQRDSIFTYGLNQTRQTFKRCVSICREAALKIKTTSGIRFQDEKEYGCWFKKLLEVVKSISNCQPTVIRPGTSTSSNSSNSKWEGTFNESITKTSEKRPLFAPIHETTKMAKKMTNRRYSKYPE